MYKIQDDVYNYLTEIARQLNTGKRYQHIAIESEINATDNIILYSCT